MECGRLAALEVTGIGCYDPRCTAVNHFAGQCALHFRMLGDRLCKLQLAPLKPVAGLPAVVHAYPGARY